MKSIFESYSQTADEIRQIIRSGDISSLFVKVLMRNVGDYKGIIEINGVKFAIDDVTWLKFSGIRTEYSQKKPAQYFGIKTGEHENQIFASLPRLKLEDFKTCLANFRTKRQQEALS
jgi:hypothetical protein